MDSHENILWVGYHREQSPNLSEVRTLENGFHHVPEVPIIVDRTAKHDVSDFGTHAVTDCKISQRCCCLLRGMHRILRVLRNQMSARQIRASN